MTTIKKRDADVFLCGSKDQTHADLCDYGEGPKARGSWGKPCARCGQSRWLEAGGRTWCRRCGSPVLHRVTLVP